MSWRVKHLCEYQYAPKIVTQLKIVKPEHPKFYPDPPTSVTSLWSWNEQSSPVSRRTAADADCHAAQSTERCWPISTPSSQHASSHSAHHSMSNIFSKVRYTLATKLNSTRSILFKSTKSTVSLWPRTQWQQSWPHSATKSTATSCRFHAVADMLPKPATELNVLATVDFVANFGNSRLSTKSTVLNLTLSPVCTGLQLLLLLLLLYTTVFTFR